MPDFQLLEFSLVHGRQVLRNYLLNDYINDEAGCGLQPASHHWLSFSQSFSFTPFYYLPAPDSSVTPHVWQDKTGNSLPSHSLIPSLLLKLKNGYTASIYLIAYGVWRFFIEYLRNDPRGSSGIDFLSPSQLTAIIMVVVGVVWFLVCKFLLDKYFEKVGEKVEKPHQA